MQSKLVLQFQNTPSLPEYRICRFFLERGYALIRVIHNTTIMKAPRVLMPRWRH